MIKALLWIMLAVIVSIIAFYVILAFASGALSTVLAVFIPFAIGYGVGKLT